MDNKDFLVQPKNPENGGNNFPDFSEAKGGETLDATISEINNLSGNSREAEEEISLAMPPGSDGSRQEVQEDVSSKIVVEMGDDGRISGSEFNNLKVQVDKLSNNPAELNDVIQGLSEKITGGGK